MEQLGELIAQFQRVVPEAWSLAQRQVQIQIRLNVIGTIITLVAFVVSIVYIIHTYRCFKVSQPDPAYYCPGYWIDEKPAAKLLAICVALIATCMLPIMIIELVMILSNPNYYALKLLMP